MCANRVWRVAITLQSTSRKNASVKTIYGDCILPLQKREHIHREVEVLRCISFSHAAKLLLGTQHPAEVFIVLQDVEGGDLFDWLIPQQIP